MVRSLSRGLFVLLVVGLLARVVDEQAERRRLHDDNVKLTEDMDDLVKRIEVLATENAALREDLEPVVFGPLLRFGPGAHVPGPKSRHLYVIDGGSGDAS